MAGRDKDALLLGGCRIVERQLAVLRRVAGHVVIVAPDGDRFDHLDVQTVPDALPNAGPLGGLYTAVTVAPTSQVLVVACDLPFLEVDFLRRLMELGRDVDVAVPCTPDGFQPLCASYSRACAAPIRRRLEAGALKVTGFYDEVRVREVSPREVAEFDPDGMMFFNVNTPDDYDRARAWLGEISREG